MTLHVRRARPGVLVVALAALTACQAAVTPSPAPAAASPSAGSASPTPGVSPPATPESSQVPAPATPGSTGSPPGSPTAAPSFDPAGLRVELEPLADAFEAPLAAVDPGDGSGRIFVVERGGAIWIVGPDGRADAPFLDISGRITAGGERGLLGLAFHPEFPDDPRFFVNYTDGEGDTRVSSFTVRAPDAGTADAESEEVLLRIDQPYSNHNGGVLVFGPEGYLHVGMGDGGSGGDPHDNGQRTDTLLGKILRIDVDEPSGDQPYGIPGDNPFADGREGRAEILHWGLRNPWRMSFDRATGDLWIGDVGQNSWEEIDVARAGRRGLNFGWARTEGFHCFPPGEGCARESLHMPVAEYGREGGCTVVGGHVYRGSAQPALSGAYLFADYCAGSIWVVDAARDERQEPILVAETGRSISSFGEDAAGELLVTDIAAGEVLRVVGRRDP
jgi:glucose/arabinose dehydrogenase